MVLVCIIMECGVSCACMPRQSNLTNTININKIIEDSF